MYNTLNIYLALSILYSQSQLFSNKEKYQNLITDYHVTFCTQKIKYLNVIETSIINALIVKVVQL